MISIFRAILEVFLCLFQLLLIPLAHVADDRVYTAKLYAKALDRDELLRQSARYWSLVNILRRAARRQARMNVRGQAKFEELQARTRDKVFQYEFGLKYIWMVCSITYGMLALEAVIGEHFPLLAPLWQSADAAGSSILRWFWNLLPGPDA